MYVTIVYVKVKAEHVKDFIDGCADEIGRGYQAVVTETPSEKWDEEFLECSLEELRAALDLILEMTDKDGFEPAY